MTAPEQWVVIGTAAVLGVGGAVAAASLALNDRTAFASDSDSITLVAADQSPESADSPNESATDSPRTADSPCSAATASSPDPAPAPAPQQQGGDSTGTASGGSPGSGGSARSAASSGSAGSAG